MDHIRKAEVTGHGLAIPKQWLAGVDEMETRKEQNMILILPDTGDLILQLGAGCIIFVQTGYISSILIRLQHTRPTIDLFH